jgi:D-arginine dehydrogenase
MREASAILIGGGVAGLSTAAHLAWSGARGVVLLERESQLGVHSSGLNAAILRTSTPDPATNALLREGAAFLREPPPGFAALPLVEPVGLVLANEKPGSVRGGDGGEALDDAALSLHAPHFAPEVPPGGLRVRLFAGEGRLDIAALVEGFARAARAGGVAIETGARVERLTVEGGAVVGVRLSSGEELRAPQTAICAGGWASSLGASAASRVELEPKRRHLLVTPEDQRVDPRWPVVWDDAAGFYARPESGGLLLSACDEATVVPDHCHADPAAVEGILAKAARLLPSLEDLCAAHLWCGMRTFADDSRFVVGPDPDVPGLSWVAGLGGHGMGASPAVGRLAAARLLGRSSPGDVAEAIASAVDPARLVPTPAG